MSATFPRRKDPGAGRTDPGPPVRCAAGRVVPLAALLCLTLLPTTAPAAIGGFPLPARTAIDALEAVAPFPAPWPPGTAAAPVRVAAARCSAANRDEAVRCALAAHPGAEILSVSQNGRGFQVKLLTRDGVVRTVSVPRR